MSSVSATTLDSTAQGSGSKFSASKSTLSLTKGKKVSAKRKMSVQTFKWGRPPKNIYAANHTEQVSQREWETLNDAVRSELRAVAVVEADQQRMATTSLSFPRKSYAYVNPLKERIEDFEALVSITEESDYRMWHKNDGWHRLRATRGPTGNCTSCHGVTTRVRRPLFTPEMYGKIMAKGKGKSLGLDKMALGRGPAGSGSSEQLLTHEIMEMDGLLGRSTIGQRLAREKMASKVEEERKRLLEIECERRSQPYIAVTELYLPGNNLGRCGTFPSYSVALLSQLVTLVMSDNHFEADLSDVLMQPMPTLEVLDLTGNRFRGGVPEGLAAFKNLKVIKLGRNLLAGPIPGAWGSLKSLDFIDLHNNKLTGEVLPRALVEGATNLREIRAGANLLDRFEIPCRCKLRRVDLFNNRLTGEISESVQLAGELTHLNLVQNALVGDLPVAALSTLPLVELYLNHNNFAEAEVQGAELQANLPNCRISVDVGGFGSPFRAAAQSALYERISVDDYSVARPDSPPAVPLPPLSPATR